MPGLDKQLRFCRGNTHYCIGVGRDAIWATDKQIQETRALPYLFMLQQKTGDTHVGWPILLAWRDAGWPILLKWRVAIEMSALAQGWGGTVFLDSWGRSCRKSQVWSQLLTRS